MKQFVVIGIGMFGYSIATTLSGMGHQVLAIDIEEENIQAISDEVTHAVQADATDEEAMKELDLRNFDTAVVAIGTNMEASIMATMLCKEMGIDYVLSKAHNELHAKILYKIGADKVLLPEIDMGKRVAQSLVSTNIMDYIELTPHYRLEELASLPEWAGKSLKELNVRSRYGVNVMAIKHGDKINISPQGNDIIEEGDVLVVIGEEKDIRRFRESSR